MSDPAATTYSIYFQNNYGETQNYAFFTQPPIVTPAPSDPKKVFSNVWISKKLAGNGASTSIKWTTTYYAWCGKAPQAIEPGVVISDGHGVAVTLGAGTVPGSTRNMSNDGAGTPYFLDQELFTSKSGCFEIDTISDFNAADNFLIGMGAIDSEGRMVPAATIPAPRNAKVNFQPVVKFYVAAYDAAQGTTFNYESVSNEAALIDFTSEAARGKFGAIVKQDSFGQFSVTYASQLLYTQEVTLLEEGASTGETGNIFADVALIKRQVEDLFELLKGFKVNAYTGTLGYFGGGAPNWQLVYPAIMNNLQFRNYVVSNYDLTGNNLRIFFSRAATDFNQAKSDWNASYDALGLDAKAVWSNRGIANQLLADKKVLARKELAAQGINGFDNEITA